MSNFLESGIKIRGFALHLLPLKEEDPFSRALGDASDLREGSRGRMRGMCGPEGLGAVRSCTESSGPRTWHRLPGSESDEHQRLVCLTVVMQEACLPSKPLDLSPCLSPPAPQYLTHSSRASMEWLELKLQLEGQG